MFYVFVCNFIIPAFFSIQNEKRKAKKQKLLANTFDGCINPMASELKGK
jgi:hypothetical protein